MLYLVPKKTPGVFCPMILSMNAKETDSFIMLLDSSDYVIARELRNTLSSMKSHEYFLGVSVTISSLELATDLQAILAFPDYEDAFTRELEDVMNFHLRWFRNEPQAQSKKPFTVEALTFDEGV